MNVQDRDQKTTSLRTELRLSERFRSLGFESLTEIQKRAVPAIHNKKDCLVIAPTGSGKTECAVVPIFLHLASLAGSGKIRALYITPLRALNRDVFRRITTYAEHDGLYVEIRHGDTPQRIRKKISLSPPDVLITTPETLVILLSQKKMLDALSELEWVVIDEVHELLASERGSQLSLSLERLAINSRKELTRVGLSATVGNPGEAAKFVSGTKRRCEVVRDSSVRRYDVEVRHVDGSVSDVAAAIVEYLGGMGLDSPVLLFTNSRGEAELLASILKSESTIPVELHHGSLSRQVREETEDSLRAGRFGIVVCTSSLELGLDIGSVELVIHYGSPRQASRLIQRIGRSRHRRGSSARGLIITNNADDKYEAMAILERIAEKSIEEQKLHHGSLDVLAHHLVGLTIQLGSIGVDEALELVRRAYPFRGLDRADMLGVIELLDSRYLLRFDRDKMVLEKKASSFRYHFENLSTIPDMLRFRVFDSVGKKIIGSLDQRFVGSHGDQGNVFVLRGSQWRILNVDDKSLMVNVEPFESGGVTIPYWEGENIPVDYATARKVGRIRRSGRFRTGTSRILQRDLEQEIAGMNLGGEADEKTIVVESSRARGVVVIHSCFGTRVNSTISALLTTALTAQLGSAVESRSDAYRIALTSHTRLTEAVLYDAFDGGADLSMMVTMSLDGTHNINWRTWCVSKKFGIVGGKAVYERKLTRYLHDKYEGTPVVKEAIRELLHDKYDIDRTQQVLDGIRAKTISVRWRDVDEFSKLADPILDHISKYYSSPARVNAKIIHTVKKRLEKTVHRLVCARCGRWERSFETCEVPELLSCPYCKGRQITATFHSDRDLPELIRRRYRGARITASERRRLERAWKISSLVESFGRTALTVLSGYGVGADVAARILRNMVDEETLFRQIHEAERQYVMTRRFWAD